MKGGKQRERTVRYHGVELIRRVKIPGHIAIKRGISPGKMAGS